MPPVRVGGVVIDTTILDKITKETRPKASAVVRKYTFAIAGEAAKLAPVDTGALRSSIVSESHAEDLSGVVQDGVEYGIFQELGTSRMAAQPFLVPAVEKYTDDFLKAFEELFK